MESTYCNGPILYVTKDITKNDIMNICNTLYEIYDRKYDFSPEKITEGGIYFSSLDNKNKQYKSFRFCVGKWPWINDNEENEWINNEDVIFKKGYVIHSFLKADIRVSWTLNDVIKFIIAFQRFGIEIDENKIY